MAPAEKSEDVSEGPSQSLALPKNDALAEQSQLKRYRLPLKPEVALRQLRETVHGEHGPFAQFRPLSWRWRGIISDYAFIPESDHGFVLQPNEEGDPELNARARIRGRFVEREGGCELQLERCAPGPDKAVPQQLKIMGLSYLFVGVALTGLGLLNGRAVADLLLPLFGQMAGVGATFLIIFAARRRRAKRLREADLRDMLSAIEATFGAMELGSGPEPAPHRQLPA